MKKLFLSLLTLCSVTTFAQRGDARNISYRWEVGFNTGVLLDAHGNKFISDGDSYQKNRFSFMSGIYVARNVKQWQLGLSIDFMSLDAESLGDYLYFLSFTDPNASINFNVNRDYDMRLKLAAPAIPIQLFVNRKLSHTRLSPYVGISAGYIFCHRPALDIDVKYPAKIFSGIVFGAHVGASYKVSDRMALTTELSDRNMRLYLNGPFMRYALSATVGLKYYF